LPDYYEYVEKCVRASVVVGCVMAQRYMTTRIGPCFADADEDIVGVVNPGGTIVAVGVVLAAAEAEAAGSKYEILTATFAMGLGITEVTSSGGNGEAGTYASDEGACRDRDV
jgi:hypothetical protein